MRVFDGRWRCFFVIATLLNVALLAGWPAEARENKKEAERYFLWKVSSKTTTVYLLGSMHMAKADLFPLPKAIEDAFADAKKLVVEVNTEDVDQAKMQKLIFQKGLYPAGETLSKKLSKKTLEKLEQHCASRKGLTVANLDPLRPWLVNLLLMVEEMKAQGFSEEGIDKHFLKKAKAQQKPIVELEKIEAQLDLFTELSPDLQDILLAKSLADAGQMKNVVEKVIGAWKAGDVKAMEDVMLRDPVNRYPEAKALMVKMFDDRNVKMAEKITDLLKGKETCFVVVGAGHLVGDKGIIKLLEAKKYQPQQVRRVSSK